MGRERLSREESRRLTRERLLESAAEVFARRGYYGASVEEIAESAGYSRGAVYSNFSGKDDVFLSLLDRILGQQRSEDWGEILDDPGSAFESGVREGRVWYLLLTEFFLHAMRDERAREKLAERYRASRDGFAAFVERRYAGEGRTPPVPAESLSWLVVAVNHGLAMQAYLDPEALPEGLAGEIFGYMLHGPGRTKNGQE